MSGLFDQIDAAGSGSINQGQFTQAFQTLNPPPSFQAAGAEPVWGKLDSGGQGSVTKQEFVNGMTSLMKELRGTRTGSSESGAQQLEGGASALDSLGATEADSISSSGSGSTGTNLSAHA